MRTHHAACERGEELNEERESDDLRVDDRVSGKEDVRGRLDAQQGGDEETARDENRENDHAQAEPDHARSLAGRVYGSSWLPGDFVG